MVTSILLGIHIKSVIVKKEIMLYQALTHKLHFKIIYASFLTRTIMSNFKNDYRLIAWDIISYGFFQT